jgi:hypothetical protein
MARWERLLIAGIIVCVVSRFVVTWESFGDYGVNPWVFAAIDLATAWPYARAWPRVLRATRERRTDAALRAGLVLAACLAAPYLYVAAAARHAPAELLVGLGAVLAFAAGLVGMRLVRAHRSGAPSAPSASPVSRNTVHSSIAVAPSER